ncbi:hypothetical protein DTW90_16285 [Neorhizobium sp. P12A]|jgi:hypothetical protein|uniref:hypothetical protein n=1 Tax=Rhizobium/Agrobacterium group TaxID=227290 RepID=UPI0010530052|nr:MULTISPECIES: hypothetical protein [Rhizobium/Agrobacterium group]KAA0698399.1 hypothetical protein DTW90_16285 [Neorhizobium sp. P12A]TCR92815.1 hypothetical protein EV561_101256 [Rhizobium sp. BK376]
MTPKVARTGGSDSAASDKITYMWQMLGELRNVAESEGADLLCYLIEMAYVEAGDILAGQQSRSIRHGKRN